MVNGQKSFTLIELLIVIGILSVVAVVAVWIINPAELLKRSRDSNRLSDLRTLNTALGIVSVQGGTYFGSSSVVYVSIPDSSSTCGNLGLPVLPSGWSYNCKPNNSYRNVDSTGWVPVNFTSLAIAAPLSVLPIDPINTTSSGLYFTYVAGGSWELTTLTESTKYAPLAASDGGVDPAMYEIGNDIFLSPFAHGLVGYWKLDESSGILYDSSGYGNSGAQSGGVTYGAAGKVGTALSFDGGNDVISVVDSSSLDITGDLTLETWVNVSTWAVGKWLVGKQADAGSAPFCMELGTGSKFRFYILNNSESYVDVFSDTTYQTGSWHHVVVVKSATLLKMYVDGTVQVDTDNLSGVNKTSNQPLYLGGSGTGNYFNGLIDNVRIYNRALSAAEINAIYNATK